MDRKKIIENVYVVGSFNENRIQTFFVNDFKTSLENLKENGKVIEQASETYTLTIYAESREIYNQLNEILSNPLAENMFSIRKNEDKE